MRTIESKRLEHLLLLLIVFESIILINMVASTLFFRIDLTEEQRFSITKPTKDMLSSLEDDIYIEVYLDGDLPAGFRRMRSALLETLEEFRVYSNNKIQYQTINPDQAATNKSRQEFFNRVAQKGLPATDIFMIEGGKRTQKRILPGVVVSYGSREIGVQLFKGNQSNTSEQRINQSIEGIEYELAQTINAVTQNNIPTIGILNGNDELSGKDFIGFRRLLEDKFNVRDINLSSESIGSPDVLLMVQPKTAFSIEEKYKFDQYIMNGGNALLLIDKLAVTMDSAATGTYSFPYDLDLDDLLFRYGVRINDDLVQDFVSGVYPVVVGNSGDKPNIQLLQWPFFPIINAFSNHVIVRNLDALKTEFISSLDTVKASGIRKQILFTTSSYSRKSSAPVHVDINSMRGEMTPDRFENQYVTVACLLEGKFTSYFNNRFLPDGVNKANFRDLGDDAKIIVISDGDVAKNLTDPRNSKPLPLGYDPFLRQTFSNADLLLNCVTYMIEGNGLIMARAKEVKIRPLDKVKIKNDRRYWQIINLIAPLVLLLIFGIAFQYIRKIKYSKF